MAPRASMTNPVATHAISPTSLATDYSDGLLTDEWRLVVADDASVAAQELRDTFDGLGVDYTLADSVTGSSGVLRCEKTANPLLACGVDVWQDGELRALDLNRDAIAQRVPTLFFVCTPRDAHRIARLAPNAMSFIQGETADWSDDTMTAEQVEARLAGMRAAHGLTDAEVVALATRGELPVGADFDAWLVLLGQGYALGNEALRTESDDESRPAT